MYTDSKSESDSKTDNIDLLMSKLLNLNISEEEQNNLIDVIAFEQQKKTLKIEEQQSRLETEIEEQHFRIEEIKKQHTKLTAIKNIEAGLKESPLLTLQQGLKGYFNNPLGSNPLLDWQYRLIIILKYFLNQIKIMRAKTKVKNVVLSYAEEDDKYLKIKTVADILKYCFDQLDINFSCSPLTTVEILHEQLRDYKFTAAIILCTPKYTQIVTQIPEIRNIIRDFGERRKDALHTLLCDGGFENTAFKIVDRHFLVRDYKNTLNQDPQDPLVQLLAFIDIFFNLSGANGLGILPDILDLKEDCNLKARVDYKKIYAELEQSMQILTIEYYLSNHLKNSYENNIFKNIQPGFEVIENIEKIVLDLQQSSLTKTALLLSSTSTNLVLTNMLLEQNLLKRNQLVLSIDCVDYAAEKSSHQAVRLSLKKLKFKDADFTRLRQDLELIIIFKNYDKLNTYDNLYVRNKLASWPKAKIIVTCLAEHFQHRGYESCFLSDPNNPQLKSLEVFKLNCHLNLALETKIKELIIHDKRTNILDHPAQQEDLFLSPKTEAMLEEFNVFLRNINQFAVKYRLFKENFEDQPQIFISYAWEDNKKDLIRQQNHLRQLTHDLVTLGFPTWLDVERMTGDINQQMVGNIANSQFVLVIATPRYTQRAMLSTNVKKEYHAIKAQAEIGKLKVIPILFTNEKYTVYVLPEKDYVTKLSQCFGPTLVYNDHKKIKYLILKEHEQGITLQAEEQALFARVIPKDLKEDLGLTISLKIYDIAIINDPSMKIEKNIIYFKENCQENLEYKVLQNGQIFEGIITYKELPQLTTIGGPFTLENLKSLLLDILEIAAKKGDIIFSELQLANKEILNWLKSHGYKAFTDKLGNGEPAIVAYSIDKISVSYQYETPKIIDIRSDQPMELQQLIEEQSLFKDLPVKISLNTNDPILSWLIAQGCPSSHFKHILSDIQKFKYCELNFTEIDKAECYIKQLTEILVPHLLNLKNQSMLLRQGYQIKKDLLYQELQFTPAKHLLIDLGQEQIQAYDIDNRLEAYVASYGLKNEKQANIAENRFKLTTKIECFLNIATTKTLVILGQAGSGKSLLSLFYFKKLLSDWHAYKSNLTAGSSPTWLPIYIPLKDYAQEKAEDAISLALNEYGLGEDLKSLQQGLGRKQKILFILDGYDELGKGIYPNYAQKIVNWEYAKILITGRIEHFEHDGQHIEAFALLKKNQVDYSSFEINYLAPFIEEEINEYIKNYTNANQDCKKILEDLKIVQKKEIHEILRSLPGLIKLLDNPFLLNLVLQSLPKLLENKNTESRVIRSEIYQAFIDTWFIKEVARQEQLGQILEKSACHDFAEQLAFLMFTKKTVKIDTKIDFFNATNNLIVRETCPLRRSGLEYSFIHKSVYEFFVATYLWKELQKWQNTKELTSWGERLFTEETAIIKFLIEIQKIANCIKKNTFNIETFNKLFKLIELSKNQSQICYSGSNAATILNAAGVAFSTRDLSGTNLSGANLRGAVLDSVNLEEAYLTDVNLTGAWLHNANLRKSILVNAKFGELPYFRLLYNEQKTTRQYFFSAEYFATTLRDNAIVIYKIDFKTNTTNHYTTIVAPVQFVIKGLAFNCYSNKLLLVLYDENSLLVYNINEKDPATKIIDDSIKIPKIYSIALSSNNAWLALGGQESIIYLKKICYDGDSITITNWDKRLLQDSSGGVIYKIKFNSDNNLLVAGARINEEKVRVCFWDLATQRQIQAPFEVNYAGFPLDLAVSADNKWLAVSYKKEKILLYERDSNTSKYLNGHTNEVHSINFNTNSDRLVSGSYDKTVRLWSLTELGSCKTLKGHTDYVCGVAFSSDDRVILSGSDDQTVRFWDDTILYQDDYLDNYQSCTDEHSDYVYSVYFSSVGKMLASGSRDQTIILRNFEYGTKKVLTGHDNFVFSVAFSYNNHWLVSGSKDGTVRRWTIESLLPDQDKILYRNTEAKSVRSVLFSHDDQWLAWACGNYVYLYNNNEEIMHHVFLENENEVYSVAFSPNSLQLASGYGCFQPNTFDCCKGTIFIWNVATFGNEAPLILEGHTSCVDTVTFSPDDKWLVSGGWDKKICLWQRNTTEPKQILFTHSAEVNVVTFSKDGRYLFSGDYGGTLIIWQLQQAKLVKEYSVRVGSNIFSISTTVSASDDQLLLATGCADHSVRIWKYIAGEQLILLETTHQTVLCADRVDITEATLASSNKELLKQRGAIGEPIIDDTMIAAEILAELKLKLIEPSLSLLFSKGLNKLAIPIETELEEDDLFSLNSKFNNLII